MRERCTLDKIYQIIQVKKKHPFRPNSFLSLSLSKTHTQTKTESVMALSIQLIKQIKNTVKCLAGNGSAGFLTDLDLLLIVLQTLSMCGCFALLLSF